jgi:hypothetical protein
VRLLASPGDWPRPLRKLVYRRGLVRRDWYYRLRLRAALSNRIRVGFGPITTGEDDLGMRKWHIDPIVDAINRSDAGYTCEIFFRREDIARFDIVVIVKHFQSVQPRLPGARPGARFVFDTGDIRFLRTPDGRVDLYSDPGAFDRHYRPFLRSMHALILSNPLQHGDFADLDLVKVEIARPVLNRRHRTSYAHPGPIRLVWQGYRENLPAMQRLHSIVHRLRRETNLDLRLVYDTNQPARTEGPIVYTEWKIQRWDRVLAEADVGVAIKPLDDPFQQRKSTAKVVSYMAAGLPVVCTPSEADRRVIAHGRTGFFANDDHEWTARLRELVTDASLRERIGRAARADAIERYGVDRIAAEYLHLFDRLRAPSPPATARLP